MDLGIKGRRALVLASSRGLGRGIAIALASEGVDVLLCGRNADELAANCATINADGQGRASFVVADLFDDAVVDTLANAVAEKLGGIDILVNNSGGPTPGSSEDMTPETLQTYFNAMVLRQITLANRFLPQMKAQRWGRVLTVASSGVIEPIPGLALSNTLRPALAGWSKTLATEVAEYGITANMLLPGSIFTDRLKSLDAAAAERSGLSVEAVRAESEQAIPARRYGTVEEFAATAAFLCSERASYVTGSIVRCDGGAARSV
ncbi:SDR family oxidoreductase [Mycoplana dimorpha]|uniref:3-oxoacyl-[acyl-carrier protein] reductase n=1 Tax=Mycoplana dimorpha TaxID=28320 RepID=A0A2T5BI80_MYCDI|nr:SDR family oxidoreductase [Mycoplana dimorpha]PTM98682.1 3-oxoacyl-[acyl-carrier protein] reductase [Mycoplana dimorpha]